MPRRLAAALAVPLLFISAAQANPSLVFEPRTGQVLLEEGAAEPWYPASLTKLMTAYLAFQALKAQTLKLEQKIAVSAEAAKVEPSKIGMPAGSNVSVDFALRSLLVYSANDMAVVLGEAIERTLPRFVEAMNAAAKRLGMGGTFFANPHGLHDPRQITTARDLALLVSSIVREFPEYQSYFAEPYLKIGKRRLANRNALLRQMPGADGMKTGFVCDAGFNLIGSATLEGRRLVAVVLGARSAKARADLAQLMLESGAAELKSGLAAERPSLAALPMAPAGARLPHSMRDQVCKRGEAVAMANARQVAGWGVSFGRFEDPIKAEAVLTGRLIATKQVFTGGSSGILKVPGAKDYAAVVWAMEQPATLTLCNYVRARNAHCEVVSPEAFAGLATQLLAEEAARKAAARKGQSQGRKKRQRQVPQPASGN